MALTTSNFEAFLRAYYEWLEQTKQPHEVIIHLRDYRNIDTTIDDFVEYFRREYMVAIPSEILANKRLLIDHIKKFYHNKGNKNSFQFLFRILYDEDIEIYLPKIDILRASDGKWSQVQSIKIIDEGWEDISFFFIRNIVGQTSFASANVETIMRYSEGNLDILELTFYNLSGQFVQGETISIEDNENTVIDVIVLEVASRINILSGGTRYGVNEKINLRLDGEIIGTGFIKAVGRGPVTAINIVDGGTGYRGNLREVTDFAYLPIGYTWGETYLPDAPIQAQDSNDFDFASSPISFLIATETIPDIGDIVDIDDTPDPIGRNAAAVVALVSQVGEILEIELIDGGKDYNIPIAEVLTETGSGAILDVLGGGGSITRTQLNDFPARPDDSNGIIVEIVTQQGTGGDLELLYNSGMITYKGTWINTDSFLSSDKKLQDNFFYQDFSYVILSGILHSRWGEVVKKIAHPAGFLEFGRIKLKGSIETEVDVNVSYQTLS